MPSARAGEFFRYIGANVHRGRVRLGMTQEGLAEKADLDLRFLQRVERGRTNLSVAVVVALAHALEVAPGSLFRKAKLTEPSRGRPARRTARTP